MRVLVELQRRLDEPIDAADLAKIACISPFHFHRVFRAMVGESVMEHVRRLRLERAAHRLKFTDQPVAEIALGASYEAHEAFTRAFGALFGESPSEFRRRHRAIPAPGSLSEVHWNVDGDVSTFRAIAQPPLELVPLERPPIRAAFVRHVGDYMGTMSAWEKLLGWTGAKGVPVTGAFGLVHDDPDVVPIDRLRYDACVPVGERVQADGEVGIVVVPGGRFVSTVHVGPYEEIPLVYGRIAVTYLESGRDLAPGPAVEWYLDDPQTTAPEKCRTEIWLRETETEA